ncbi:hypothetical protein D0T84_09820 [Dysgonomonas sp. 521]|nr:hypothetical protein [Dysgonomonas sp. 521]
MKKYLFIAVAMLGSIAVANAQTVTKRVVKSTNKGDSKTHYNYLLLDAVNYSDAAYAQYEKEVQSVWDKKSARDLTKGRMETIKVIDEYLNTVKEARVYKGGEAYQSAVLAYINSVKEKVMALEHLGKLGDDPNTNDLDYNKASIKFTDISNEAIDLRNIVREKKNEYEKTFYIK